MTNGWSRQGYMQDFYFEVITFKKAIKMFGPMEIAENIY